MLRLLDSKTRIFCPSEAKNARFQASLSSPVWRGTVPAQPSNGFFIHKSSQNGGLVSLGQSLRVFDTLSLIYITSCYHGFGDVAFDSSAVHISKNTLTLYLNSIKEYGMFRPAPQKLIHTEKCSMFKRDPFFISLTTQTKNE